MKSISAYVIAALFFASKVMAQDYCVTTDENPTYGPDNVNCHDPSAIFRGITARDERDMSPNNNPWTTQSTAGAIIGFALLGVSWLYVVVYIFYDINRSYKNYQEMIDEDKDIIRQLNVSKNTHAEWEAALALRLSGKSAEAGVDD